MGLSVILLWVGFYIAKEVLHIPYEYDKCLWWHLPLIITWFGITILSFLWGLFTLTENK